MRQTVLTLICTLAAAVAAAQPGNPCSALPNGGRLTITVPGVLVDPACSACGAGVIVPPNFVLGYSDASHDTCELKKPPPDGTNSGLCKAATTCPPATTRTTKDGVVKCEAPSTSKVIECPAPPRVDAPKPPRTPQPPRQPACVAQLKEWASRLKQREAELRTAIGSDAGARAGAIGEFAGAFAEAVISYGLVLGIVYAESMPLQIREAIACDDDRDTSNPTVEADCRRARDDFNDSARRAHGFVTRVVSAAERGDAALKTVRDGSRSDPAGKVARAAQEDLNEAKRQIDACLAELQPKAPTFRRQ